MNNFIIVKMLDKLSTFQINSEKFKRLVWVAPKDLFFSIVSSLVPPINIKYKKIPVDLIGPIIAIVILILFLNYGSSFKRTVLEVSPLEVVFLYIIFTPILCFILNILGQSWLTFLEVFCLIGYALYGHIFALVVSFLIAQEKSDAFFFICLVIFGGLSTLRMILLQLQAIPLPGARLIICTFISVVHILFLVFLHFTFMHPSFVYGKKHNLAI